MRVLLDVSALLLEPFSREGAGGLRGLIGKISNNIEPIRGNLNEYIYIYRERAITKLLVYNFSFESQTGSELPGGRN